MLQVMAYTNPKCVLITLSQPMPIGSKELHLLPDSSVLRLTSLLHPGVDPRRQTSKGIHDALLNTLTDNSG